MNKIMINTLKNAGVDTDLFFHNPKKTMGDMHCVICKLPINDIHKHYEKAHPETAHSLGFTGERK